jgi:hypothetical protein
LTGTARLMKVAEQHCWSTKEQRLTAMTVAAEMAARRPVQSFHESESRADRDVTKYRRRNKFCSNDDSLGRPKVMGFNSASPISDAPRASQNAIHFRCSDR